MKTKRTHKRITKAEQPAPSFNVARFNRLTPAEIIAMPQPVPNLPAERLQNSVRVLLASCGLADVPPGAPEWAVKAAGELTKCFNPPKRKKPASEDYRLAWQMGLVSGLMPLFELRQAPQNRLAEMGKGLLSAIRSHASQLPANEAAEVFDGLRDGEQSAARVTQLPQRTKLFALLVFLWPEIAACKSTGELYKRLLSVGAIAPSTDAREIRKVCKIIGLRYSDQ
jgi:hypothetical protein